MTETFLWSYFRGLRRPLIFAVAIFIVGFVVGIAFPHYFFFSIRSILEMGAEALRHGRLNAVVSILAQNLMASYLLVISGVFFGLLPTLALVFNGAVLGAAIRYSPLVKISHLFLHIAPHGVLEIPAYIICAAIGLHCGQASIQRLGVKEVVSRWHFGTRVFVRVAFPLLVAAAFIEVFVSMSLP